ncbi:MAG: J domain-containing protein [Lentisphaeria bacterium]|nr:MAG: J domain-containing protein [Lentisphaeria bacterium]
MEQTLYQVLGVSATANFAGLKRAYYARARECHPDLFGNSPVKTREFQILVHAFDILSDPEKRKRYDASLMEEPLPLRKSGPLMDSEADDILEELIVGNNVPPETSLATLLADLEKNRNLSPLSRGARPPDAPPLSRSGGVLPLHRRPRAAEHHFPDPSRPDPRSDRPLFRRASPLSGRPQNRPEARPGTAAAPGEGGDGGAAEKNTIRCSTGPCRSSRRRNRSSSRIPPTRWCGS